MVSSYQTLSIRKVAGMIANYEGVEREIFASKTERLDETAHLTSTKRYTGRGPTYEYVSLGRTSSPHLDINPVFPHG